jgi:TonB-linked SusC/RagA family outer membrane protein
MLHHRRPVHAGPEKSGLVKFLPDFPNKNHLQCMKNKPKRGSNALLFLMKLSLIQLLLTSVSVICATAGETRGQEVLDRTVSVAVENAKVKDVLTEIQDKAGINFTYRSRVLKGLKNVTLNADNEKVRDILNKIFESSVDYEVVGKQVILTARETEEREPDLNAPEESMAFQVSGVVADESGATIPGVNVIEKGTANGTTTDAEGKYTIVVGSENATLTFSFIGFTTQDVGVAGRSVIDIKLVSDTQTLDEVVVVGYGEQRKVTVTGSVVAVNGSELQKSPAIDLSNSFAGRLAGVVAVQTSGEPGNDGSTIRIRGVNSIGNTSPLVVIDGIPDRDGGLNRLSPQDIETISVLKDASSAIYGSRAANGVILITTKRGKSGAPQISYDFNQGWSQPTRIPKMSNAYEYAQIMNEIPIYKNFQASEWGAAWAGIQQTGTFTSPTTGTTLNANYSPSDVAKYKDHSDPWGHPDTDWFGDAFNKWSPQGRHNIQISGGNENVKYMSSMGYTSQDAYYKNTATYYKQYNFRINLDAKVNKYINTSLGIMAREENRNFPTQSAASIFRMLMRGRPTEPEVWPNGLPGPDIENGQNPYVITTNATGYDKNPRDFLQTNGKVEITNPWIEGLKLTVMGSADKTIDRYKKWETPWYLYTWDKLSYEADGVTPRLTRALRSTFSDPRLTMSTGNVFNTNLTGLLNYDKSIGKHNIGILAGTTREKFTGDYVSAYRRDYISSALAQPFFGGPTQMVLGGNDNTKTYNRARLGYYGRVQYNYAEKYLVEFLWRRDGSSFFPKAHRYGFFPGLMVGWNISNEGFFKGATNVFNFLKLRASYGQMGNDQIYQFGSTTNLMEYAYLSSYVPNSFPINNSVATTLMQGVVANPNFTWEVSNNSNIGLEGTVLNNKLDFTLEYFYNRRSRMLIYNAGSTPSSTGMASDAQNLLPPVNGGKMQNKGFEFTLSYHGNVGALNYQLGANAGYNHNKVIYMNEVTAAPSYQWQTGHPYGAYLAYQYDGVFKNQEEIASEKIDYSAVTSTLRPGDMKFVDYNHDGKITADDKVRLDKTTTPNFNFGATINLQYRNFDLSILIQGATGALLRFGTESGDIGNYLKYSYDHRWSIDNPSSVDPRLAIRNDTYYTGGEYSLNTYYLYNKNYVRIKNVEFGYNFPKALTTRIGLQNFRLYVNGLNLVTWDKYKIFDPETTAGSGQYYPQARVLNTGLRLTF